MSDLRPEVAQLVNLLEDHPFHQDVPARIYEVTALITRFGFPGDIEEICRPLLLHPHYLVRYEMAIVFRLHQWWRNASGTDRLSMLYALREFQSLNQVMRNADHPSVSQQARHLLTKGLFDPAPMIREKAANAWSDSACSPWETFALMLAQGAYHQLPELIQLLDQPEDGIRRLTLLSAHPLNSDFHQRQAERVLQHLHTENDTPSGNPGGSGSHQRSVAPVRISANPQPQDAIRQTEPGCSSENIFGEHLVNLLAEYPVFFNGAEIWPTIHCRTKTGRIAYRDPGLLSLPKQDRRKILRPPPSFLILSCDVRMMEPTVLTRILVQEGRLERSMVPEDYSDLGTVEDRSQLKRSINRFINGGTLPDADTLTPFGHYWCEVTGSWQMNIIQEVRLSGEIQTITGRIIPVERSAPGWERRAINRVVQGSAADLFHHAVCQMHTVLTPPHRLYLVLYDAVWILWDTSQGHCPGEIFGRMLAHFLDPEHLVHFQVHWDIFAEE